MNIHKSNIPEVLILESNKLEDDRGWFQESYHLNKFLKQGIDVSFVQDNLVYSKKNILRGLHLQKKDSQGKLISCLKGKIFDVAVDLREKSATYKNWTGYLLSEDDNKFIYIPEGFAHGYSVESNEALVHYKCTKNYNPANEIGIIWNDPDIKIDWPQDNYILSDRDLNNIQLKELIL